LSFRLQSRFWPAAIAISKLGSYWPTKGMTVISYGELLSQGIRPVTPPKASRKNPPACDFRAYRDQNRVERMFNQPQSVPRCCDAARQDTKIIRIRPGARRRQDMAVVVCKPGLGFNIRKTPGNLASNPVGKMSGNCVRL
jgi:hypothetical protein